DLLPEAVMPNPLTAAVADRPQPSRTNGGLLNARANPSARTERRHCVRHPCNVTTACVVISLVDPLLLTVRVTNLSQQGIGLVSSSRVAPGAFLAIKVQGPRQK